VSSLAVVGVDGTAHRSLRNTPVAGRAHIKTGSLDDVGGMAGYVLDRSGRRWAVVLLVNHDGLTYWEGRTLQEALLRWVHGGPTPVRRAAGADATPVADAARPAPSPGG
jgi:D-alanyl-D-alanine carboxypeptidase/D-alanyl-D-alanine-endopeptidase (penicillin-binding protein 4)